MTGAPDIDIPDLGRRGDEPLVSAIVPTYEDAHLLGPALESIADQTYDSIELVIVDSSGVPWLKDLAADTEGLVYVYQDPEGLAAARNRGIAAAGGELVAFLDADDRWYPEKTRRQMAEIEAGADVVYADVHVVTGDGSSRRLTSLPVDDPERHHIDFLYEGGAPIVTVLARRECFETDPFNEDLPAVEDRNLLARLFASFEPARVSEPLAAYRQRDRSMSSDVETMYESELASLDHLADEIPEVADHLTALEALARYKHGKRLLRNSHPHRARRELAGAIRTGHRDYRTIALLGLSLLPAGHERALWHLERLEELL